MLVDILRIGEVKCSIVTVPLRIILIGWEMKFESIKMPMYSYVKGRLKGGKDNMISLKYASRACF